MEFNHKSVLFDETIDALNIKPDGVVVDCTGGGGGHSAAALAKLGENGRLIVIDRDPDAIQVLTFIAPRRDWSSNLTGEGTIRRSKQGKMKCAQMIWPL